MSIPDSDAIFAAAEAGGWKPSAESGTTVDQSSFERGLRSSIPATRGSLNRLVGSMGESLGYTDFAAGRYKAAERDAAEAQAIGPTVRSFDDVHDLRSGGQWLAGMLGGSVPVAAAGLGAALTARTPLRAMIGGTAATTPFEAGHALESYAQDPVMAAKPIDERLETALPVGAGAAAAQMVAPMVMGGKMLGKTVSGPVRPVRTALGANVAEGAITNAAAGVGAEGLRIAGEENLNPLRDRSKDESRLLENLIGGGAVGGVFGLGGAAGEIVHSRANASGHSLTEMADKAKAKVAGVYDAVSKKAVEGVELGRDLSGKGADFAKQTADKGIDLATGLADKGKEKFDGMELNMDSMKEFGSTVKDKARESVERMREVFGKAKEAVQDSEFAKKIMNDEPLNPVTDEASFDASERTSMEKARKFAEDLMKRVDLSDETKQRVAQAGADLKDAANRAMVAGEWAASRARDETRKYVGKFAEKMRELKSKYDNRKQKSEDYSGVRGVIQETIMPVLKEKHPDLLNDPAQFSELADSLAAFVQHIDDNKPMPRDSEVMKSLYGVFGESTRDVLERLYTALGSDRAESKDAFYGVLNNMLDAETSQRTAEKIVADNIDPAHNATPEQIRQVSEIINDYLSGRTKSRSPAEDRYISQLFDSQMREMFGDKADKVMEAFVGNRERTSEEAAKQAMAEEKTGAEKSALNDLDTELDPYERQINETDAESMFTKPRYYGGKDSPFVPTHEAHVAKRGHENSQHARLMERAARENPDRSINSIPASEYAKLTGMDEAELMRLTGGKPDEYAVIAAEAMKNERQMDSETASKLLLDSRNFGDSKSRINTTRNGVTLDATKVTAAAMKSMAYIDGETYMERTSRAFKEGLADAMDFFNAEIKGKLPDDLVVAYRNGEPLTVAKLREKDMASRDELAAVDKSQFYPDQDLTLNALRKEEVRLTDAVEALKKEAYESLKGTKASKEEYRRLLKDRIDELDVDNVRAELDAVQNRLRQLDAGPEEQTAMHGQKAEEEIHLAAADPTTKRKGIEVQFGLDGNPITYARPGAKHFNDKEQKLTYAGKLALQKRIDQMRASDNAIERKVGERADKLLESIDSLDAVGQLRMLSMVGDSSVSKAANIINALDKDAKIDVPKANPFEAVTEAIKNGGKTMDAAIQRVAKATDTAALKQSVDHLLKQERHPNIDIAVDAINRRISHLLEKNPGDAYGMQLKSNERVDPNKTLSGKTEQDIRKLVNDMLGPQVKVAFEKIMHAGDLEEGVTNDIMRVSVHALNPTSVAYHESLHGFFSALRRQKNFKVFEPLFKAADSEHVLRQMNDHFANQPEVLKQIKNNAEERVAYMFQLWATNGLTVAPAVKNIFTRVKDAILGALGIWTNHQRAEHIMNFFSDGDFAPISKPGDKNAVAKALLEPGRNKTIDAATKMIEPATKLAGAIFSAGGQRLRDTTNPSLARIADMVMPRTMDKADDPGYLVASRSERTKRMNDVISALHDFSKSEITELHDALKLGKVPTEPRIKAGYEAIRKHLDDMFDYMREAGVNVSDLGYGKDYFPRAWDAEYISKNQAAFGTMLGKYVSKGLLKGSEVDSIINKLMASEGSEMTVEVDRPGMQNVKHRALDFITPDDAAPFMNKNLFEVLNNYTTQATRRGEWARRFNDDGSGFNFLLRTAEEKYGATREQLDMARDYARGVNGTLGDHINPTLRRLYGNMIVYQNVRLLPLAIFSSVIDPLGIAVRGGTAGEAFKAFKRGVMEIPRGFKKDPKANDDYAYGLAEAMGVIDNTALTHTIGSLYSQGMVSNLGRRINDSFFRFNLMEQFNTSMRVSAMEASMNFLKRHVEKPTQHSTRFLEELGLKADDVIVKQGRPLLTVKEFMDHGMNEAQAVVSANKMRAAVNRWVDGAVLRPNASDKPVWMNDPHWALVSHLKQFVYSFQTTILDRVIHEAKHGNMAPALTLASYVPIMIASDLVKGMIQGGGQQPSWKNDWDAADYLESGISRAGLYGVGQFPIDFMKDFSKGGMGVGTFVGPTANQMWDGAQAAFGREQFSSFGLKSMPANSLYGGYLKSAEPQAQVPEFRP